MFANSMMGGVNLGFPDVCMTPIPAPTPIPYPNMSMGPVGFPPVFNVLWQCTPAHHVFTTPMISFLDTPGVATGVASATMLTGGMPTTRMTTFNIQNNTNCPGMTLVPSQIKVIVLKP
jgi:hypothetical protein